MQLGYVETTTEGTTKELLNILRDQAHQNGADAVINVKKGIEVKGDEDDVYTVASFSGIAVKYITNKSNLTESSVSGFNHPIIVETESERNIEQEKKKKRQGLSYTMIALLAVSVISIIASN